MWVSYDSCFLKYSQIFYLFKSMFENVYSQIVISMLKTYYQTKFLELYPFNNRLFLFTFIYSTVWNKSEITSTFIFLILNFIYCDLYFRKCSQWYNNIPFFPFKNKLQRDCSLIVETYFQIIILKPKKYSRQQLAIVLLSSGYLSL